MIFRNRLGRKISFSFGQDSSPFSLIQAMSRKPANIWQRQLEYEAYLAQEDWRNPDVVKHYHIKK